MLYRIFNHWRSSYSGIPLRIWFLSLVSLINRSGAMVVVFLTIYLTQHLHYGIEEAGYVLGCFGAGAFVGAYSGGKLTDRFNYYPIMLWSLVLNGIMLVLLMFLGNFWLMCGAVFLLSLISEVFRPANSVAFARYSTPENRTRSISLYRMSVNLGWTVAPALGGMLASLGWHWLFVVDGLTCLLAAGMLWLLIAPKPAKPKTAHTDTPAAAERLVPDTSPYQDRHFLLFTFFTVLNAIVFMQLLWTIPVFFKETYHWSEHKIGLITALNGLIIFLIEMPLIYVIEGKRPRLQYVRLGVTLYALAYLTFLFPVGALLAALIFILAITFGEIFVMPFSTNFVFSYANKGTAGSYMALYTMGYSVANIISPLMGTQVIARWGYDVLWIILAVLAAISWTGFWALERQTEDDRHLRRPAAAVSHPS
ncbi:MAG: MFS transporter [Bacteroidetes bacterium]|nr:MAG: MFS transporter [Bacteroidota bacterium]